MKYYDSILDLIGGTPLLRLQKVVEPGMATVLAKLEYLNPGGSVKDRMAVHMLRRAEEQSLIKPGGTIVESTSGNTGMGLAVAAAARGYHCVFTIPDKMSKEKIDMLKAYGAEVVVTPTDVAHDAPESYVEVAKRIARDTPGAYYTDQYNNMTNPEAHYLTTGPEIWEATEGKVDCLVGGIGTGGTMSGAGKYLKEQAAKQGRQVRIVCPDPIGSVYHDKYYDRQPADTHVYAVEGIGHDFVVATVDFKVIDEIIPISDKDSFLAARRLAREEGIFAGGSGGTATVGALKMARELGPDKVVVVILPDSGDRYMSKCYDDEWMKDNGYLDREERMGHVRDVLAFKGDRVETCHEDTPIAAVVGRMSDLGISQMPVMSSNGGSPRMIREADLLHDLIQGTCRPNDPVSRCAKPMTGYVSPSDPLSRVEEILSDRNVAVVQDNGRIVGIISKIDVVRFLAART